MAGNIIPVSPGTANITVGYNGLTTVVPITVNPAPAPTLPSPSGLAFVQDDYTSYTSQANFLTHVAPVAGGTGGGSILYNDGANAQWCTPDGTVLYNGHQTMQYYFPASTAARPELWVTFGPRQNVWFRVMIRFVPGFTTWGTGPNQDGPLFVSKAYKLIGWSINNNLYDGSGRIEISNFTEYQCYWGASTKTGTTVISTDTSFKHVGQVTTEWDDGLWNQYILNYYAIGGVGYCNTYLGRGSATPVLASQGQAPNLDGLPAPFCTGVQCGMNYNRVRGTDQNLYLNYGFWEAVDGTDHPNPFGLVLP
jgi:hypothetical protein